MPRREELLQPERGTSINGITPGFAIMRANLLKALALGPVTILVCALAQASEAYSQGAVHEGGSSPQRTTSPGCNQTVASLCQNQASGCYKICQSGLPANLPACQQGCISRYDSCKASAGCRDY